MASSGCLVALLLMVIFCSANGQRCCGVDECNNSTLLNVTAIECGSLEVADNCICINYTSDTASVFCVSSNASGIGIDLECNRTSRTWQTVENVTRTIQVIDHDIINCGGCCQENLSKLELCRTGNNPNGIFASGEITRVLDLERKIGVMEAIINISIGEEVCANKIMDFVCRYIFPECDESFNLREPCLEYCEHIIEEDCVSEWTRTLALVGETAEIYNEDLSENPLGFLGHLMPANCSNDSLAYYSDWPYSNDSCVDGILGETDGTDYYLEEILIVVIVVGVSLVLALLVAIACVIGWWRRWQRARVLSKQEEGYSYSYRPSFSSRTATLLGWPFVHPRTSRFKSKGDLFKMVPQHFMEVLSDQQHYLIQPSKVHTNVFLAEGSYSEMYQGYIVDLQPHQTSTYRNVIIKRFKDHVKDSDIIDYLESALKISNINHPNTLKVIAVTFNVSISIVYPYFEEHDLLSFLKKKRTAVFSGTPPEDFSVRQLVDIILHIALGMAAIAEMGIPYKMLSAHTCLVDKGSRVVVGDVCMYLQMAMKGEVPDLIYHRWMAPEGIKENMFTEKSDVWSYAVTSWEVFTLGSHPYNHLESMDVEKHVANGNRLSRPPLCPAAIFSLLEQCWAEKPRDRPFFHDIADTLNNLLHGSELKTEIANFDESLRQGKIASSLEAIGITHSPFGGASPHIGSLSRKLVDPTSPTDSRNLYLSLQANEPVYMDGMDFSPMEEVQENVDNYEYADPKTQAGLPRKKVTDIEEEEDYENIDLGSNKRHSLGAVPSGTEAAYYNLPKGYLEAIRTPKKSKSSNELSKSELDRNRAQSDRSHTDKAKAKKSQPKSGNVGERPFLKPPVAEKPPVATKPLPLPRNNSLTEEVTEC